MKKYNGLVERYENIKKAIVEIEEQKFERLIKKDRIEEFMKVLRSRDALLEEFDREVWNMVVEAIKVYAGGKVVFVFKDGMEVEWLDTLNNNI